MMDNDILPPPPCLRRRRRDSDEEDDDDDDRNHNHQRRHYYSRNDERRDYEKSNDDRRKRKQRDNDNENNNDQHHERQGVMNEDHSPRRSSRKRRRERQRRSHRHRQSSRHDNNRNNEGNEHENDDDNHRHFIVSEDSENNLLSLGGGGTLIPPTCYVDRASQAKKVKVEKGMKMNKKKKEEEENKDHSSDNKKRHRSGDGTHHNNHHHHRSRHNMHHRSRSTNHSSSSSSRSSYPSTRSTYYNQPNNYSYNPPPWGLSHLCNNNNNSGFQGSSSQSTKSRDTSHKMKGTETKDGKRRKSKRDYNKQSSGRRKQQRDDHHRDSFHQGHDQYNHQQGGNEEDESNFNFYNSSRSTGSCNKKRRRRSRSTYLSYYSDNSKFSNNNRKDTTKKKRRRHHRRHQYRHSSSMESRGDDRSSDSRGMRSVKSLSSHDDTVGHFHGKPGTLIHRGQYRIICNVGMGTFGRVVQCERVRGGHHSDEHNRGSFFQYDRRESGDHHISSIGSSSNYGNNDKKYSSPSSVVAIKIIRNVRRYIESALIEGQINERVNREQYQQNKDLCARLLDRFSLSSGHYCLVFECLGRSLYDYLKIHNYKPFPMYCVRDFARQLLEALDFIHGFGLIHTDLKPENILLMNNEETPYHSTTTATTISRDRRSSSRRDRREYHQVQRVPASTKVKLIDFGGATYNNEKKSSIVNTRQYRAPEVILGWGWSYPSDLWSAGCIIAEMYTGSLLFATHDNAEHLALIECAVGPFRPDLLSLSGRNSSTPAGAAGMKLVRECFDSCGWHKIRGVLTTKSIEHVRRMVPIESLVLEHDRPSGLGRLLKSLLTIDPMHRVTAREALMSPFFTQPR